MNALRFRKPIVATGLMVLACALMMACDGDSAETLVRNVGINVSGFYSNNGNPIVSNNTGAPITSLNVRQSGDQLEATDNNGIIYKGTLGQVSEEEASFTLEGQTTAGQSGTISGQIRVPVGSTDATMTGSWVEPSLFGTVAAFATVPLNEEDPDDGGDGGSTNTNDNVVSEGEIDVVGYSYGATLLEG